MIALDHAQTSAVSGLLVGAVVDARLELTSRLGGTVLGTVIPAAGSIVWDDSGRRGRLDVDAAVNAATLHPRHPLANLGQVLEARWTWPDLGVSVPCGRWLIAAPSERSGRLWQVSADPEGPARLSRAQWWEPGGRVVTGSMAAQLNVMLGYARVKWAPAGSFGDHGAPATECQPGGSVMADVQKVLDHAGVEMRPSRYGPGVDVYRQPSTPSSAQWTWNAAYRPVLAVKGSPAPEGAPNRVTVWCEEDIDGVRKVRGWSEPLRHGPRRWDGPYGQVPLVVQLDGPATVDAMRTQARNMLRRVQESAATVRVEMRADPRVELGDIARVIASDDGTDCVCRVTSVSLDVSTGLAVVEASALSGLVAGTPAATIES